MPHSLPSFSTTLPSVPPSLWHAPTARYIQNSGSVLRGEVGAHHTGCTKQREEG